ncbi:MAG: hypothetical protein GTO45_03520 [Candidatus Aminicenantes bacterium]|nr:hypothetical protein [Candidatus Aminicenantes bacterium]NIM77795.1 hypothetical protein [Candidatus Aminicenantes bacterium]NIN17108.1 hypothetical protein [Candidatus Aminicenantes bacterium]NIN41001.1 hypothetical protein [Candidatus Aminicenantes bacterium]NIN83806.1 hypothetical protein [Candidatus Aminicenantes bacterium]
MKDTSKKMERIYNDMLMRKTPEERVKMCFSMLGTARRIVLSTITDKKNWRKEMFLRFYGDEFTPSQKEKILSTLENFSINRP